MHFYLFYLFLGSNKYIINYKYIIINNDNIRNDISEICKLDTRFMKLLFYSSLLVHFLFFFSIHTFYCLWPENARMYVRKWLTLLSTDVQIISLYVFLSVSCLYRWSIQLVASYLRFCIHIFFEPAYVTYNEWISVR